MKYELGIPAEWQIGPVDAQEARPGAMQQAVVIAIQKHLLGSVAAPTHAQDSAASPAVSPSGTECAGPFEAALRRFGDLVSQFQPSQSRARAIIDAFRLQEAAITAADVGDELRVSAAASWTGLFCTVLHALCWSIAASRAELTDPDLDGAVTLDEDEDGDGGEDEDGRAELRNDAISVEQAKATAAVARALRVAVGDTLSHGEQPAEGRKEADRLNAEHYRLVAKVLLEAVVQAMPEHFAFGAQTLLLEDGQPKTRQLVSLRSAELATRVQQMLQQLPTWFTAQPLTRPVAYAAAQRQSQEKVRADQSSWVRIPLVGYRRWNAFLVRFQSEVLAAATFPKFVVAVDAQQAVPWRINRQVCFWLLNLRAIHFADRRDLLPAHLHGPVQEADLDDVAYRELQEWVGVQLLGAEPSPAMAAAASYADANRPGRTEKSRDFLVSPLVAQVLQEIGLTPEDGKQRDFYLPWKADYRSRIYAHTPWLTPQGGDAQRALFEFARGQVLDDGGASALRQHGANLAKRGSVLHSLKIVDRQVVTPAEREAWVQMHEAEILASARTPLRCSFWREHAGKPMQFLAFCLAYLQWKENPGQPIHLPVQIDGTCNGLQHISALTGDATLAEAVNVLPGRDGLPGDIYSRIAETASKTVGSLEKLLGNDPVAEDNIHRKALLLADTILGRQAEWHAWIDRGAAKKVVMTVPYGASEKSQARHLLKLLAGRLEAAAEAGALPEDVVQSLDELTQSVLADDGAKGFVRRTCKGEFKAAWRRVDLKEPGAEVAVRRLRVLAAYTCLAIVKHLRLALSRGFPALDKFSNWLNAVANRCEGLPLMWTTPLGLPVCQDGFQVRRTSLNTRLGHKTISVGITELLEDVDHRKQKQALLPNLIHSLDATHLALTLVSASRQGLNNIGSIHDCLLCRPNEADKLAHIARQTFAKMYAKTTDAAGNEMTAELKRWSDWMAVAWGIARLHSPGLVLGAIDMPGGAGEQMLQQTAAGPADTDEAKRAKIALAVLESLRKLESTERAMARLLLDHAANAQRTPVGFAGFPKLPTLGALPLGHEVPSPYFFS